MSQRSGSNRKQYDKKPDRSSGQKYLIKSTMPSVVGMLMTSTSTKGSAAFLAAEARGSRIRQRNTPLDNAEAHHLKLRSRITLAKVKGYWE